ncbi:phosphoribosyl 1,2-cyclic phosphodiesterase [Geothermobacter ehrlichii]|uniref:Phosphoribosyl 1,2-cyclic phosphodiesterase n=1 Tax=Geothermobacter ehrlichii TaxID=213224 RepID=A0A5D3WL60_9BACT|nr:MBL fold metallo-hydrolase [Geothermobacter ehrlichii]TYO99734.1 phosphoribosyl 1,2-cyclic phosphodiesterase [Geothermobacter ehrlichii]
MRVCLLASGSKGNAIYLEAANTRLLVDAGLSARQLCLRLERIGVRGEELDAILVSHEHMDHCRGLGAMARRCALPVHVHHQTLTALPNPGKIATLREFDTGNPFSIGEVEIHPVPLTHDAVSPVGFVINTPDGAVGVATDLGVSTRLVRSAFQRCRVLVLETNHDEDLLRDGPYPWRLKQRILGKHGHLSNRAGADLLADLVWDGLEAVFLAHLSETNNTPAHARAAVDAVLARQNVCRPKVVMGCQDRISECVAC